MAQTQKGYISIKARLDTRKLLKKTNNYAVKLFVRSNSGSAIRKEYNIGVQLTKEEWDKIHEPNLKDKTLIAIGKRITKEENRADAILEKLGDNFSFEAFELLYTGKVRNMPKDKQDVYQAFKDKITELDEQKCDGNSEVYSNALISLKTYRPALLFKDVTVKFLEQYENWMLNTKGLSPTTLKMYICCLRKLMNDAVDNKIISVEDYPFGKKKDGKYTVKKPRKNKRAMPLDHVQQIINYPAKRECDRFGQAMWTFILYANGLNVADLVRLKFKNRTGKYIRFYREKTKRTANNQELITVTVTPRLQAIIDEWGNTDHSPQAYIFPLINWDKGIKEARKEIKLLVRKINDRVQWIAAELQLDSNPTTYAARHSFGTLLMKENVPVPFISKCYGHSSLEMTSNYLGDFTEAEQDLYGSMMEKITKSK